MRQGGLLRGKVRQHQAVRDVSFQVAPGEIVGYLGPNGAGKSTTIKVLTGLLVPDRGHVHVGGLIPWRERRRHVARLGAVFGQRTTLWWDLPVRDSLDLLRHVYRVSQGRFRENLQTFTDLLDLGPFLGTPARALSLGQRMRADLAAALLHDPELLFLDEPTVGLDVVAKERIREFVRHINAERGVTVLLTTHDLGDVERLAQRVMIIDQGACCTTGTSRVCRPATAVPGNWWWISRRRPSVRTSPGWNCWRRPDRVLATPLQVEPLRPLPGSRPRRRCATSRCGSQTSRRPSAGSMKVGSCAGCLMKGVNLAYLAYPPPEVVERRGRALAVLDAVLSPEWEERYFSFDQDWSAGARMASARNGSGDEAFMLFSQGECVFKQFLHEVPQRLSLAEAQALTEVQGTAGALGPHLCSASFWLSLHSPPKS
ncbi:ATP-binding cassette domain-containing protein [Deinococcus malanensis]|uniref:ABC transporter ATP-binding protein n=1 Tax=Deinococcus malanensis TaxID=1706855 RepID=UPI0036297147